jgi:hypothetical protein
MSVSGAHNPASFGVNSSIPLPGRRSRGRALHWYASGSDETRQLEGPLIERRGRLTPELEVPHADQAVRKFRSRVLPDEQGLLDRRLPLDLQF